MFIQIKISKGLKERIKEKAEERATSMSGLIRTVMLEYLDEPILRRES